MEEEDGEGGRRHHHVCNVDSAYLISSHSHDVTYERVYFPREITLTHTLAHSSARPSIMIVHDDSFMRPGREEKLPDGRESICSNTAMWFGQEVVSYYCR